MENKIEYRMYTAPLETRVDDNRGNVIEGTPIVFEQPADLGWWTEIIDSNALSDADLKDVRLLVNHDFSMVPLARSRNNTANSTMQLTVESDGLHIRADLDEENPRAKEVLSAVKRRDLTGMSFAFTVDKEQWSDIESEKPTRRILGISRVFEVSAVTDPAYNQTEIYARSLDSVKASLDSERAALENAKKVEAMRLQIKERSMALCKDD